MTRRSDMDEWMIGVDGVKYGPYGEGSIREMLSSGRIPSTAVAWRAGMVQWVSVVKAFPAPESPVSQPQETAVRYAGFWQRAGAWLIDMILLSAGVNVLWVPVNAITDALERGRSFGVIFALQCGAEVGTVVMFWLYYAIQESSSRQATVGKLALGIRVTDLDGNRVSFGRATGRFFAVIVTGLSLGIGYLVMLWSQHRQCIQDLIARTLVLRK